MVVFQLALGLQLATASAAAHTSAVGAGDHGCPLHATTPKPEADKHDCCKLSGSQCQCGGLALAIDVIVSKGAPVQPSVLPTIVTHRASAPADSHFRPPIAS
jgi:hypothetical protein